jgi:protease-4
MADRTTITGSIGIFGMIPNVKELLNNKLGITQDVVTTNETLGYDLANPPHDRI